MENESLLKRYSKMLERYGFSETYTHGLRSSFDIISKKRDRVMILKFVENIDSLSKSEALSLKKLNGFFDADVFVVFNNYKGAKVDREMLFTRHGVDCVSQSTLESVLNGAKVTKAQKFISSKYKIDSGELKRLRKLQNMSMRKLSYSLRVSKDTIYRYEKGNAFTTAPTLKKIEAFFKTSLLEVHDETGKPSINYKYHRINSKLDVKFINVGSSPFHMLGRRHFRYEIGNEADSRTMKKMATFYKGFSSVLTEDYPFFITKKDKKKQSIYGIPVLSESELEKIKEEKELIDILASRTKS